MITYLKDIIVSFLSVFYIFAVPGLVILYISKLKAARSEYVVLSPIVGMVTLTLVTYVLAWMKIRFLLPFIPIACILFALIKKKELLRYSEDKQFFGKTVNILLCIMGIIYFIPFISSGDFGSFISLIGVHFQDSSLHVAIINELIHHFPPSDPGFAGNALMGYHFFYNFSASIIASVAHIPSETVHFRVMPLLFAFSWPSMVFILGKRLFKNTVTALFIVFFTMFGASFSCFFSWYYHIPISYNSGLGILQPSTSLLNPPFASSVIVLLLSLYVLYRFEETGNKRLLWLLPLCFGSLVEYKVYAGITGLAGFGFYTAFRLKKYAWKMALSGLAAVGIAFLVYWPFTGTAGFLLYAPLWAPHEIARAALPFLRYDNGIYVYGQVFDPVRIIILETQVLLFFIIGNLGLRLLGFAGLVQWFRKFPQERVIIGVFVIMFLVSFVIPLMFMQSLKPYEISQMFNYSLFALSFTTAYYITSWIQKKQKIIPIILALVIIAFSLPSFQNDYAQYFAFPTKTISSSQYQTFSDITRKNIQYGSIMQLPPTGLDRKQYNSWFRSQTNMQLSAFTHASSFLAFTNIIYKESEVTKRLNLIAQVIALNTSVSASGDTGSAVQEQIHAVRKIFRDYAVTYVVSPSRLDGLVKANILSPVSASPSELFYKVN